jgi:hypothetical protein
MMLLLAWVHWAPVSGGFVCEPLPRTTLDRAKHG